MSSVFVNNGNQMGWDMGEALARLMQRISTKSRAALLKALNDDLGLLQQIRNQATMIKELREAGNVLIPAHEHTIEQQIETIDALQDGLEEKDAQLANQNAKISQKDYEILALYARLDEMQNTLQERDGRIDELLKSRWANRPR